MTITGPKHNSKFPKVELRIPFYGTYIQDFLRDRVRFFDLRQLLSASIAVYRLQARFFDGVSDGKSGIA
jgi:hypothetical protein